MTDKALAQIEIGATIGINEVVNVFVTKHEDDLYIQKAERSKILSNAKQKAKKYDDAIEKDAKAADSTLKYNTTLEMLDLVSIVDNVSINWKNSELIVRVKIKSVSKDIHGNSINSMYKNYYDPLSIEVVKQHKQNHADVESAQAGLTETMNRIKDISRKERQIRGEISRRTLEDAGMEELLNDKALQGLICLDDMS